MKKTCELLYFQQRVFKNYLPIGVFQQFYKCFVTYMCRSPCKMPLRIGFLCFKTKFGKQYLPKQTNYYQIATIIRSQLTRLEHLANFPDFGKSNFI